jgi:hypothetical protein
MCRLYFSAAFALIASTAFAQRPSTEAMSCGEARALVASRGAVVLSTGRNTYDRFVADAGFCSLGEYAYDGWAPTADARRCPIGLVCKNHTPLFGSDSLFDIPGR